MSGLSRLKIQRNEIVKQWEESGFLDGAELSKILLREIKKEIAISMSENIINSESALNEAIFANMNAYSDCVGYDNKGAAESLTRAIQLIVMNIRNKHCQ